MNLRVRIIVLNRDGHRCQYCGRSPQDGARLEIDHVIPLAKGGTSSISNLITACFECNRGKKDVILSNRLLAAHWSSQPHRFSAAPASAPDTPRQSSNTDPLARSPASIDHTSSLADRSRHSWGGSRPGAGRKRIHANNAAKQRAWRRKLR